MLTFAESAPTNVCASCGAAFVCGALAGSATCWCMGKPTLAVAAEAGAGCYCSSCLEQRLSALNQPSPPAT